MKQAKTLVELQQLFQPMLLEIAKAERGNLYPLDMMVWGIAQRSVSFINAFVQLMKTDNHIGASCIIRAHLDSLLTFYGAYMTSTPHEYATHIMEAKPLKKFHDRNGKPLHYHHIAETLSTIDGKEWVINVYKTASKHIHFSHKHIFGTISNVSEDTATFVLKDKLEMTEEEKIEYFECMIAITEELLHFMGGWCKTKELAIVSPKK